MSDKLPSSALSARTDMNNKAKGDNVEQDNIKFRKISVGRSAAKRLATNNKAPGKTKTKTPDTNSKL